MIKQWRNTNKTEFRMNVHQRNLAKVEQNPKNKRKDKNDIESKKKNVILFCSLAAVEVRFLTY